MTEPPLPGRHLMTKASWRSSGDLVGSMQRPSAEAVLTISEVQPQDASGSKQVGRPYDASLQSGGNEASKSGN